MRQQKKQDTKIRQKKGRPKNRIRQNKNQDAQKGRNKAWGKTQYSRKISKTHNNQAEKQGRTTTGEGRTISKKHKNTADRNKAEENRMRQKRKSETQKGGNKVVGGNTEKNADNQVTNQK